MFLPAAGKRKSRRSLAAACTGYNDKLLFIEDSASGRRFLVDSGAQRSIVPPSSADSLEHGQGPPLDAANGTPIRTFGTRMMTVCFKGRHSTSKPINKKTLKQRFLKLLPCYRQTFESSLSHKSDPEDGELSAVSYRPDGLDRLVQQTNFTKKELQVLYRGFKNECPSGVVNEETFKTIYAQFFPQGDSTMYAHFLFDTFDIHSNGSVSFEDFVINLSIILRGSITDKLNWAFNLYDLNKDGCITREEMTDIMSSIYDMMGKFTFPSIKDHAPKEHVDNFFQKMDRNNDGVVTIEEFLDTCQKDENIMQSMHLFDNVI